MSVPHKNHKFLWYTHKNNESKERYNVYEDPQKNTAYRRHELCKL